MEELKQRLVSRGHDSQQVMEARLAAAKAEIVHTNEAHYKVINDDFDRALEVLLALSSKENSHG